MAFLPQFVRPEIGNVAIQLAWFGFLFIVATLVAFAKRSTTRAVQQVLRTPRCGRHASA